METSSLKPENVKVLPIPDDLSEKRGNYRMFGQGYNPTLPKEIIESYPDKVLGVAIDNATKHKLIGGEEDVYIMLPDQKDNELYEIHINQSNELILTKYKLDSKGEPETRSMRNVNTSEVAFNNPVNLEQQEKKRPLKPWENPDDGYSERKSGMRR